MQADPGIVPVATIGFTGKSAKSFFDLLARAGVKTVLDVRLNNTSQLAGFAKKQDLAFFLKQICSAAYIEVKDLAPEAALLKRYQSKLLAWDDYADAYLELLAKRRVESALDAAMFDSACLLCSEHLPHRCHRRLALEYLNSQWGGRLAVTHLV
ncbi:uncharacterized protein (DUF488 family) [Paraburkholderia sp. GAS199]|uniref:DUF488 domain-containing protein n=1 Tax=Paraburkholderia sp. GAS199 TaxID=3035126 RepID=UPI003D2007A4